MWFGWLVSNQLTLNSKLGNIFFIINIQLNLLRWRNISKSTLMSVLVILARFLCLNDRQNGRKSKNKVQIAEILCFFLKEFQTEQLRRLARKKQKPIDFSLCAINCVYTKAHFFSIFILLCLRHDQKFKITL